MQLVNPQDMKVYESDTDLSESSQLMGTPLQTMTFQELENSPDPGNLNV